MVVIVKVKRQQISTYYGYVTWIPIKKLLICIAKSREPVPASQGPPDTVEARLGLGEGLGEGLGDSLGEGLGQEDQEEVKKHWFLYGESVGSAFGVTMLVCQ